MNPILSPYILIMVAALIISLTIILMVRPHRFVNSEALPLIMLMSGIVEWILAALGGLLNQNLADKMLWAKIEYIGVVSVPLALVVFLLYHSSLNKKFPISRLLWLSLIPLATLFMAWTNGNHGLIWAEYIPYRENGLVLSQKIYGVGFWIYWVYSYLLLLAATVLTFQLTIKTANIFRWQSSLVIAGILFPWVGNLLYVLHVNPFGNLDLTPLAFSITGIMLAIGMFRWRLFDIKPVAHAAVIAGLADGVMILDNQDRIIDANPTAQVLLGLDLKTLMGKPMQEVLANWLPKEV